LIARTIRPAGEVYSAAFCSAPLFTTTPVRHTKSQKDGIRYEQRVQKHIQRLVGGLEEFELLLNPWILFHTRRDGPTAVNFCQPDILLVERTKVTIIECKLAHTNDSWIQLRKVYEPVLKQIYKDKKFALLEVCKWFDPHTPYSETFYYCEDVLKAEEGKLGIHIHKPRGRSS